MTYISTGKHQTADRVKSNYDSILSIILPSNHNSPTICWSF